MVQECLTNVHRHSGSAKAAVRMSRQNGCITIEVEDEGQGDAGGNDQEDCVVKFARSGVEGHAGEDSSVRREVGSGVEWEGDDGEGGSAGAWGSEGQFDDDVQAKFEGFLARP